MKQVIKELRENSVSINLKGRCDLCFIDFWPGQDLVEIQRPKGDCFVHLSCACRLSACSPEESQPRLAG